MKRLFKELHNSKKCNWAMLWLILIFMNGFLQNAHKMTKYCLEINAFSVLNNGGKRV